MLEYSADLKAKYIQFDAGLKAVLLILLAGVSFLCETKLDYAVLFGYLGIMTAFFRSGPRFILKNLLGYSIIFVFPYLFGLALAVTLSKIFPGLSGLHGFSWYQALLKMVKIFILWYIGSLYFFTTPLESVLGMMQKVLSPLNSLGIPVRKYLTMLLCIINVLINSVDGFRKDILEQVRQLFNHSQISAKTKVRGLADILVGFLANSLQKTDEIQKQFELTRLDQASYTLRISKNEIAAFFSLVIFILLLKQGV